MKNWKIYYLSSSDSPNIPMYIGYTGRDLLVRLKEHIRESKSRNPISKKTHKENWILKCLRLNFEILITLIEENIEYNTVEEKEIYYIGYYKLKKIKLKNLTGGGDGQKLMSEETKNKIRNFRLGKPLSQETKEKIRLAGYNRKHSEQEKIKMSKSISLKNFGKKLSEKRKINLSNIAKKIQVNQYSLNGELIECFDSVNEAFLKTGVNKSSIVKCCKGDKYKSSGGFIWKYEDGLNSSKINIYESQKKTKIILQFDLNGNFLKEWRSASEIERVTQIPNSNISACCRGVYKTAGQFIWKFKPKEENINQTKSIITLNNIKKPIIQYSFDNILIREFDSIQQASDFLKIKRSHISNCCKGKARSAYGFIWKFKSEVYF